MTVDQFDDLVSGKIDEVLERHLMAWTTGVHRDAIRRDIISAINNHLDWPCVHEEVEVRGLTTRCTSCNAEVDATSRNQGDQP